eukprot:GHVH01000197.1.p1 GENE.GHVH01000197.1~~GHVH01000197.1.p1  ORF type:complete len:982 (+),score=194.92 GHVH01000197.1:1140-4085(+)
MMKLKETDGDEQLSIAVSALDTIQKTFTEKESKVPKMTSKQKNVYASLVKEDEERNRKLLLRKQRTEREKVEVDSKIDRLKRNIEQNTKWSERFHNDLTNHDSIIETLTATIREAEKNAVELTEEAESLCAQRLTCEKQKSDIQSQVSLLQNRINSHEYKRRELDDAKRFSTFLTALRREIPGFHGAGRNLIRMSEQRYDRALDPALGRNRNLIIIDRKVDQAQVIARARHHKLFVQVLALDCIRPKSTNQRLKLYAENNHDVHLMTDVIKCDPIYKPVVETILGDCLICSDFDVAKQVAYRDHIPARVVTIDGDVIRKDGNLAAGGEKRQPNSITADERLRIEEDINKLKEDLRKVESDYVLDSRLDKIQEMISKSANLIRENRENVQKREGQKVALQKEIERVREESHSFDSELETMNGELTSVDRVLNEIKSEYVTLSSNLYKPMSDELNVDNIREVMQSWDDVLEHHKKSVRRAEKSITQVKHAISVKDTKLSDYESKISKLDHSLQEFTNTIKSDEDKLRKMKKTIKKVESELATTKESRREADNEIKKLVQVKADYREDLSKLETQLLAIEKRMRESKYELDALDNKAISLLNVVFRQAEDVIPLQLVGMDRQQAISFLEWDDLQKAGEPVEQDNAITPEIPVVDFENVLPSDDMKAIQTDPENVTTILEQLSSQVELETSRLAVNKPKDLRVNEKLKDIRKEVESLMNTIRTKQRQLDGKRKEKKLAQQARKDRFLNGLCTVESSVKSIYREFTSVYQESHIGVHDAVEITGDCRIDIEDRQCDTPYDSGLYYIVQPANKRWRDGGMSELSGGEKTMAAMALLFAFQTLRPAPFVVLDEVDAALDAKNVHALARYLRRATYQCVVISLKDRLFSNADSLIGVYRDQMTRTSQTISYLLTDENQDRDDDIRSKVSDNSTVVSFAPSTSSSTLQLPAPVAPSTSSSTLQLPAPVAPSTVGRRMKGTLRSRDDDELV